MTAPRDGLGTHDGDPFARDQLFHFLHNPLESRREHEIRVGAKRAYFPGRVLRIGGRFSKPTEIFAPDILNAITCSVKLRMLRDESADSDAKTASGAHRQPIQCRGPSRAARSLQSLASNGQWYEQF